MMDMATLTRKFTRDEIKTRKGRGGENWDYIEIETVIERLNEAFDGEWSFDVVDHTIGDEEILVLGRLTVDGVSKCQFGGKKIAEYKEGGIISIRDDAKAAVSDCLKKCAWMYGVGLEVRNGGSRQGGAAVGGDGDRNSSMDVHRRYFAMLPACVRNKGGARADFEDRLGGTNPANKWDAEKLGGAIEKLSEAQKECGRQKRVWQKLTVEELYELVGIAGVDKRDDMGDIDF